MLHDDQAFFGVITEQQTGYLAERHGFRRISQQLGADRPLADLISARLFAAFRRLINLRPCVRAVERADARLRI